MEHLALEIFDLDGKGGSKYAFLPDNTSITITDTSEIFASGDVWSHSFTLNTHANAHIFGTAGEIHGSRLHEQINKRRTRLWVEGLPLYLGYLKLDDEVDVDENGDVDVTFESGQKTFEDMIEGMNARDVPMLGNHLLGVAVWRDRLPHIKITYRVTATEDWAGAVGVTKSGELTTEVDLAAEKDKLATRWPKHVVHSGTFKKTDESDYVVNRNDTINTDYAYDDNAPTAHPYCNVLIGYQKKDADGNAVRGYTIHETTWPNTAPCFYVMYWFRALMKHLGIYIDENQMQGVEDLRRLFMMNTLCAYEEPETVPDSSSGDTKNLKLTGTFFPQYNKSTGKTASYEYDLSESKGLNISSKITQIKHERMAPSIKNPAFEITKVESVGNETILGHPAYATSDCFPNVDASEIISAIQDGFGIRLLFSGDFTRVRVVILRNIFRSLDVTELQCEVTEVTKQENSIRGFLMSYSSDGIEFKLPIFDKVLDKEHDTDKTGNNYTLTAAEYSDIIKAASAFNKHLYYTANGNAYVYKVDDDATRFKDLYPSLFEAAGYMTAVDGKCSGEEGSYKSIALAFNPLIVNDANMEQERNGSTEQKFFSYVGEDMEESGGKFSVSGDLTFKASVSGVHLSGKRDWNYSSYEYSVDLDVEGYIFETYTLHGLQDNFKPNDDGIAPIETHEWGLTLGVMRGSGNNAYVKYEVDAIENESPANDFWEIVPGSSATAHPDVCDSYGNEWYYDAGVGEQTIEVLTDQDAVRELQKQFPNSNAPFYTEDDGYITKYGVGTVYTYRVEGEDGKYPTKAHRVLFALAYSKLGAVADNNTLANYQSALMTPYRTTAEVMSYDAGPDGRHLIVEFDSDGNRGNTLIDLCKKAYGNYTQSSILLDHGIGSRYGRFSLKLRAEKPNPYYNPALPEGNEVVSTKTEAAAAMTRLFTTANTNLLTRPKVDNATMRAAGWNAPGNGYATVMSYGYGVEYSDGVVHEILWTPIKPDGTVLTQAQLQTYVNSFNGLASSAIVSHDTQHLILDIDTTEARGVLLHELQAIYYAEEGETVDSVTIPGSNRRYLEITNPNLKGRGLADQFYKEYSYWIRNARIWKGTVRMELAQLLSIDKTQRVTVGDVTGFIRKMQYSVSSKTGLGEVTMEIMYI